MRHTVQLVMAIAATAAAMSLYVYDGRFDELFQSKAPDTVEVATRVPPSKALQEKPLVDDSIATLKEQIDRAINDSEKDALIEEWATKYGEEYEKQRLAREQARVAQFESIHVQPYNPSIMTCEELVDESLGAPKPILKCTEKYNLPRHPYYQWSNDELASVAYSEALAAQIIAERVAAKNPEESLKLLLHATALTSKVGPILIAAHEVFPFFDETGAVNDQHAAIHLALIRIAKAMGSEHFGANEPIFDKNKFRPEEAKIDAITAELRTRLISTQTAVTGETRLKELFDV